MEKTYNPYDIEKMLYNFWEQQGYFKFNSKQNKKSFCITIPPPNITGNLHIGHAFQQTIMDTMVRYQRMQGKNTLWQMGMDHAGIATQIIIERRIYAEEGKNRYDYDREEFIKKIWQFKDESSSAIAYQMRRLGISVDWERERFTMDDGFSSAVKEVFVSLYKEGLIYRGKRLVNWDPKLLTAISDLEVEFRDYKGLIWYIRYPLADNIKTNDGKNYLVIATTRPETILGDTGVAVNPKDQRYKSLIGKFVILPIINRRIPVIGDEYVNMDKETGCVKITPAHDFNDYKVGRRHSLPMINIFNHRGEIRESAEVYDTKGNKSDFYENKIPLKFQKLERFTARKVIISTIKNIDMLEEIRPHDISMPYGDRSGVIIEPMLTNQWYVRTNVLAKPALEAVEKGIIQFIPKHYENMYFSWMRDVQDWCISRQIWWGHRIPAWYDNKGGVYVGRNENEVRQENKISDDIILHQDEDVLDTWFSSALWTFSSLGWPHDINTLNLFHPTNVIVSGFDIIFFWIARMIMMTMHFIKDKNGELQVPFYKVYMTGLIRDDEGKKMSKSNGNVIDPIDMIDGITLEKLLEKRTINITQPKMIEKIRNYTKKKFPNGIEAYGTDALRFTMVSLASTSRNIQWNMKRLKGYRNFCNKLWNASRFVLINTEGLDCGFNKKKKIISLADRWISAEFNQTVKSYREALDNFRFDIAAGILYEFIWNQFCDWYLEFTKSIINNGSEVEIRGTRYTMITILERMLCLAHPIISFITETIWQRVKVIIGINSDTIMLQPFPEYDAFMVDKTALSDIKWLKKIITSVRKIRTEMNIAPIKPIELLLRICNEKDKFRVKENDAFLLKMAYLKKITILSAGDDNPSSIARTIDEIELFILK